MLDFAVLAIFPGIMAYAAFSDLLTMKIPNRVSLALAAGFLVLAYFEGLPAATVGMHLAAGAIVLIFCFALFSFGWIGGGDAKLAAATALWLGFGPLTSYTMAAAVIGACLTIVIVQLRHISLPEKMLARTWLARLHDKKVGVPYGIALAAAGLIVYPDSAIWIAAKAI